MSDVVKWMNDIREGIWTAFKPASKDIMSEWTSRMVSNMKTGGNSYPSTLPISKGEGDLSNALLGKSLSADEQESLEEMIVYSRRVLVPYANLAEHGGSIKATPAMRKAMFARLKRMGKYVKSEANIGRGMKITFDHKAFKFVENSLEDMDAKVLEDKVMPHILSELNKIPNIEVVIGNR